jgi:hypothetical protein
MRIAIQMIENKAAMSGSSANQDPKPVPIAAASRAIFVSGVIALGLSLFAFRNNPLPALS